MKWGSRGVAKVEEMACHLSSAFKGRTLLMKILTVESIMDPLCLTFDSELSPRDNVSFQKHCPEGNNGFHVLSVFKLSTFPSFYPTIAFLWFLNTPSYTELWPDTHCLTLSLDHRGLKIVAWPCPPPSTSPPPHTHIVLCIGLYLLGGVLLCHVGVRSCGAWFPDSSRMGRVELRGKVIWVKHLAEAEEAFFPDWMVRVLGSKLIDQSAGFSGRGPGPNGCSLALDGRLLKFRVILGFGGPMLLYQMKWGCECMRERDPIQELLSLASAVLRDLVIMLH